jgi:hypothetical protein
MNNLLTTTLFSLLSESSKKATLKKMQDAYNEFHIEADEICSSGNYENIF